jgi:hypothetical protein
MIEINNHHKIAMNRQNSDSKILLDESIELYKKEILNKEKIIN